MPRNIWLAALAASGLTCIPSLLRGADPAEVAMSRRTHGPGGAALVAASLSRNDEVTAVLDCAIGAPALAPIRFLLTGPGGRAQALVPGRSDPSRTVRILKFVIDPVSSDDYLSFNRGEWTLSGDGLGARQVWLGGVVDSAYFQIGGALGLVRRGRGATMRVFAPTAHAVELLLRPDLAATPRVVPLAWRGHGLWEAAIDDLAPSRYYRLRVHKRGGVFEGIDPYSRANTAHDGHGIVVADSTPIAPSPSFDNSENVVYELHLRDMTIHPRSGVKAKGKYLGLAEEGTRHPDHPDVATGLDHLAELGVNTIHIMPVSDFANDERSSAYNWGYMPVHFNSPDGWYATETDTPARVVELKRLIDALHRRGMKVVLDVVYNHTAEGSPETAFGFNAMTDSYYYRQREDGTYWNGSGCGNEFRTESRMGRKFVLDSLKYWVREYRVDGFRFDLLGLIDLETMKRAVKELRRLNPNVFLYGEPWAAGDTPIVKTGKGSQRSMGFSVFNDGFRDAIKGSVFDLSWGYVQGGKLRDRVKVGIAGALDDFADSPLETINYVSCHDNRTLWDRIVFSTRGRATLRQQRSMANLANAIVLTSQGIPFLHAGEEFLRTKHGEENSYDKPDSINRIDWDLKKANRDVFEYYRDLIALRREHPAFRMKTAREVRENLRFHEELGLSVPGDGIAYTLNGEAVGDAWRSIVVLINPSRRAALFELPPGRYQVGLGPRGLCRGPEAPVAGRYSVAGLSLAVLFRQ